MIEALRLIPDAALVIRGPGMDYYGQETKRWPSSSGSQSGCFSQGPCRRRTSSRPPAVPMLASGLWCPSARISFMPCQTSHSKYVAAGLPVLAAEPPEVKREILDPGFGYGFAHSDPASIAAAVARLRADPEIHRRVRDARFEPDWPKLPAIYGALCTAPTSVLAGSRTHQAEREVRL